MNKNTKYVYTLRYRRLDDEDSVAVFGKKPTKRDVAEYLADNLDFELIDLYTFKDHSLGDEVIVKVNYDYFHNSTDLEFVAGYDDNDDAYFYCNVDQTFVNNPATEKYPSIAQKERAKHQTQWLIGVEPSEVKRSKEFLEKINKDHWDQDLWDEFYLAVQDPEDSNAIKDINRLAEKFLGRSDCLRDDAKALVNGLFIAVCGAGLDTLIDRSMGEEQANDS